MWTSFINRLWTFEQNVSKNRLYEQNVSNMFLKYKIVNKNMSVYTLIMNKKYGIIG